jgi:hypothetical protein
MQLHEAAIMSETEGCMRFVVRERNGAMHTLEFVPGKVWHTTHYRTAEGFPVIRVDSRTFDILGDTQIIRVWSEQPIHDV